jgi:hypothetical protein
MSSLSDDIRISELSIPGTHDTMAIDDDDGPSVQCQSMSLATQLRAGIRVLDIRCRHIEDTFAIHHAQVYLDAMFGNDVLKPVVDFLRAHPGETVLMRVKQEHDPENNTRTFAETFEWYLNDVWYHDGEGTAIAPYGDWVWSGSSSNPRLGDVRGKIVILQNFTGGDYGISWGGAEIQDEYSVATNWDLDDKWYKIQDHAIAADTGDMDDLYINFLSGSGGSFPYFVASGHSSHETGAPRLWTGLLWDNVTGSTCGSTDCYPFFPRLNCVSLLGWKTCSVYFEGTNEIMTYYWLANGRVENRTGIVMADFPGPALIKEIIDVNPIPANTTPVLPTAEAGGPYHGTEGSEVLFDASGSSDPQGDALMYLWDFDYDLIRNTYWSSDPTAGNTWGDNWSGMVWVKVSDGETSDIDTAVVSIHNVAPSVDAPTVSPEPSHEGGTVVASATFADPAGTDDEPFTCRVHYGDGSEAQPGTVSGTTCTGPEHVYAENGSYTVTIQVWDKDGGSGYNVAGHEVNNVSPTATFDNDGPVDEGSSFTLSLSDPSAASTNASFEYAFDCGDGNGYGAFTANNSATCATDDSGTRSVKGTVRDQDGGETKYTASVTVNNLAPVVDAGTAGSAEEGASWISSGSFSDPGVDTWTAMVNYGDASRVQSLGIDTANKTFNLEHTYADNSAYTITVCVQDDDGGQDCDTATVTVENVAPTITLTGASSADVNVPYRVYLGAITDPGHDRATHYVVHWGDGAQETYPYPQISRPVHVYTDGPADLAITVDLVDEDGTHAGAGSLSLTINGSTLEVDAGSDATLNEGSTFVSSGSFADPDGASWTATVDYDDGSGEQELTLNADKTFALDHTYADDGVYFVAVCVSDVEGNNGCDSAQVTVLNVAPSIALSGAPSVDEGTEYALTSGAVTDPGSDTVSEYVVHWDDGAQDTYTSVGDATHTFADGPAERIITVDLVDEDSTHATVGSLTVEINNVAPSVVANNASATVNEGETATNTGTYSDPGADTVTLGASIGIISDNGNGTWSWSFDTADGPDESQTVTVTATDSDGASSTTTFELTVDDVPPIIALSGGASVDEGSSYALTLGTITDPGSDTVIEYIVHWGDGAQNTYGSAGDVTHTYADGPASQSITVDLVDEDGTHVEAGSHAVTVNNVAPTVGPITAPLEPVLISAGVSVSAMFADPGMLDTHTAEWDWDDGTTSPGAVTEEEGSGSVAGTHTYAIAGVHTIQLTVTDRDGSSGTSVYEYVVIYNPDGGFVTGGGWIWSPAGAYAADADLIGKANFGFVAKYKKGTSVPEGTTEFQFKAGDLNFHSSSYDWLVVAGQDKAKFKGVGTVNDSGNYGFMLTGTDGSPDTFRIKIWDKDNGDAVVYDNQMGQADDSYDGTALGGGNIVVHTK